MSDSFVDSFSAFSSVKYVKNILNKFLSEFTIRTDCVARDCPFYVKDNNSIGIILRFESFKLSDYKFLVRYQIPISDGLPNWGASEARKIWFFKDKAEIIPLDITQREVSIWSLLPENIQIGFFRFCQEHGRKLFDKEATELVKNKEIRELAKQLEKVTGQEIAV